MAIGDNIRRLRVKNHMSQEELARLIGVTNQAISAWEKGRTVPKMGNVQRMADLFFVQKSAIIEDEPQPSEEGPPIPVRFATGISRGKLVFENNEIAAYLPPSERVDYAVKVEGDMFALEMFEPDDIVFVRETRFAKDKDIVAIDVEGKIVLRTYVEGNGISAFLGRVNGDGCLFDVNSESSRIFGVVVSYYRRIRKG